MTKLLSLGLLLSLALAGGCSAKRTSQVNGTPPDLTPKVDRDDLEAIRKAAIAFYESGSDEHSAALIEELRRGALFTDPKEVPIAPGIGIWRVEYEDEKFELVREPPLPELTPSSPSVEMLYVGLYLEKKDGSWQVVRDFLKREWFKLER